MKKNNKQNKKTDRSPNDRTVQIRLETKTGRQLEIKAGSGGATTEQPVEDLMLPGFMRLRSRGML